MTQTNRFWPNLTKEQRALELAKTALGWNELSPAEQIRHASELIERAQQIEAVL